MFWPTGILLVASLFGFQTTFRVIPNSRLGVEPQIVLSQPLSLLWLYPSDELTDFAPAVDGNRLYLPLSAGKLVALGTVDGKLIWKSETGGELSASPTADTKAVYVASETAKVASETAKRGPEPIRANGALRALSREGGITLWMRTLVAPVRHALVLDGESLIAGTSDGKIYCLRKTTGEILWLNQYDSAVSSQAAVVDSKVFVGTDDGNFLALDEASGKLLWRYRTRGAVRGVPMASGMLVYFGSSDGNVYAVNEADGRLRWRARTGAAVDGIVATASGLLVASLDDFVYFLSFNRGNLLWKHELDGRLIFQPVTAFDAALVAPLSGDSGVILSLRDGKTLNNVPLGDDNSIGAAPVLAGDLLLFGTRRGLMAFSQSQGRKH